MYYKARRGKKSVLSGLIAGALLLCSCGIPFLTQAAESDAAAYMDFGGSAYGITAWQDGRSEPWEETKEDIYGVQKQCWTMGTRAEQNCGIAVDLTGIGSLSAGENYRMDITYLDTDAGYLGIMYSGTEGAACLARVQMRGSGAWVTKSFTLERCAFTDSVTSNWGEKCDIFLTTYLSVNDEETYGYSVGQVSVSRIELYALDTVSTVTIDCFLPPEQTVFFGETVPKMNIGFRDRQYGGAEYTIHYRVLDEDDRVVWDGERTTVIPKTGIKLSDIIMEGFARYGVFRLEVSAENAERKIFSSKQFRFSRIRTDFGETRNETFGVSCHHCWKDTSDITMPYLKNVGVRFFRDELLWHLYETEPGVFAMQDIWIKYIDNAIANGLEPLIVLGKGNALYTGGNSANDFPKNEYQLERFADYVFHLVSELKGKVRYFEVWNEFDHVESGTGADYAAILKYAYNAAKAANPDVKIIGMAGGRREAFFKSVGEAGGYQYMDVFSFHNYPATIPENYELLSSTKELITRYAGDIEIWETEYGYAVNSADTTEIKAPEWTPKGLTERQQAMYAVRMWLYNRANDFWDKIFWYDLQDDGNKAYSLEHNFGLLGRNLNAKSAYAAIAAMNYLAADTVDVTLDQSGNNMIYTLTTEIGQQLYAVLNLYDDTDTVQLLANTAGGTVYDMYGNAKTVAAENGVVTLKVSGAPVYYKPCPFFSAEADYPAKTAVITAELGLFAANMHAMVFVIPAQYDFKDLAEQPPEEVLTYLYQKRLDSDGKLRIDFSLPDPGEYRVYLSLNNSSDEEPMQICTLKVSPSAGGIKTEVFAGDTQVQTMEQIRNADVPNIEFESRLPGADGLSGQALLIAAGYTNERMIWVHISESAFAGSDERVLSVCVPTEEAKTADVINVFVWRDVNGVLSPLTEKLILK